MATIPESIKVKATVPIIPSPEFQAQLDRIEKLLTTLSTQLAEVTPQLPTARMVTK